MTTPVVLTGDTTMFGTAQNNTQTDNFLVYGAGNTIVEGGGNLVVNGGDSNEYGWDTNTTIDLGDALQVTDQINLDGSQNDISGGVLVDSAVSIDLTGLGSGGSGHNAVSLDNEQGTTVLKMTGKFNDVTLNGDATNTIATGGGYATVSVSTPGDGYYGYTTSIKLGGGHNTVTGGDESFTIKGANGHNTIALGDGNNSITLKGADNTISVWGGTNFITAGSGADAVSILGEGGTDNQNWTYNPNNPQSGPPTDTVDLAGSADAVAATYENVVINGSGTTGNAKINLGGGNNTVDLGGDLNAILLGNGSNNVALTGNDNTVTVTDATGAGTDNVTVGNGTGDVISLAYAEATVAGSTTGTTTITQASASKNIVTINLPVGVGLISVGNGNDVITANGDGSNIVAGNGNDTVTANGNGTSITLGNGADAVIANGNAAIVVAGNGSDNVTANGLGASVTLGNGNDTVAANGNGAVVTLGGGNDIVNANGIGAVVTAGSGNDTVNANGAGAGVTLGNGNDIVNANGGSTVTLGYGNDTVSATGAGSSVSITAIASSSDTVTVGSNYNVNITSGVDQISAFADGSVTLNGAQLNSNVLFAGNNNMAFIGTDSSVNLALNPSGSAESITVQADNGNTYGGVVGISDFNTSDLLVLNGLVGGMNGQALNSFTEVLDNMTGGPTSDTLHLAGGGSIVFSADTPFTASEFQFGNQTGHI